MSKYSIVRLLGEDGSWEKFADEWRRQCEEVGDDFNSYAPATLPLIKQFSDKKTSKDWACALSHDNRYLAACAAHRCQIPGYNGWVLRMRLISPCPLLDYGALSNDAYADALIGLAYGGIKLSDALLKADHIKFHLRSPSDMTYFRAFGRNLADENVFSSTEMKGAWLYITK